MNQSNKLGRLTRAAARRQAKRHLSCALALGAAAWSSVSALVACSGGSTEEIVIPLATRAAASPAPAGSVSTVVLSTPPGSTPPGSTQPSDAATEASAMDPNDPLYRGVIALAQLPAQAELTGVAIDPMTAQLYVLASRHGIYRVEASSASLVFDLQQADVLGPDGLSTTSPEELTDLVAVAREEGLGFVVTAENDGFMVWPGEHRLWSYFCYLPEFVGPVPDEPQVLTASQELRAQGVDVIERTEAIAVDPNSGDIYAQPRTLRLEDRAVMSSELFLFDSAGGDAPYAALRFDDLDFVAGGMAAHSDFTLLVGQDEHLFVSTEFGRLRWANSLDATITGLALNERSGELVVLDGPGRRLIVLDYAELIATAETPWP